MIRSPRFASFEHAFSVVAIVAGSAASAGEPEFGPYFGKVVRVIDGDTFEAVVGIWPTIQATVSVRVSGVDAPETDWRARCHGERELGDRATEFLRKKLPRDTKIRLEGVRTDPFPGRVAADVWLKNEERDSSLQTMMLRQTEFFRAWSPNDEKVNWCPTYWTTQWQSFLK